MMKFKLQNIRVLFLAAAVLALGACGGDSSTAETYANQNTPHPDYSRLLARTSSIYQPVGEIQDTTPTFTWKAVPNAIEYMFGHEDTITDSDWHEYIVNTKEARCNSIKCSYTPDDFEFAVGDERAWWVRAKTPQGWLPWSSAYTFKVTDGTVRLPSSRPITPKGKIDTASPSFTWTPGNGATHYQLGIENDDSASWVTYTVSAGEAHCQSSECSFTPNTSTLIDGDNATWWVREKRNNWNDWSDGASFSVRLTVAYTPFEGIPNVTSIVEANGKWYGLLGLDLLEDDGSHNVSTIFTTQYGYDSSISVSITGKLYFVTIKHKASTTPGNGYGFGRIEELHSIDLISYQVVSEIVESSISISAYMTNYLVFSKRHRSYGPGDAGNATRYYKVDSNSEFIYLGLSRFGEKFIIESIDQINNVVHVKLRHNYSNVTYKKITSAMGVGLEDE